MSWAEGPWSWHSTCGARQGCGHKGDHPGGGAQSRPCSSGLTGLCRRGAPGPLRSQRAPHCTPDGSIRKGRGRGGWGGILGGGGGRCRGSVCSPGGLPSIPWPSLTPHPGFIESVPGPAHRAHRPQMADCQTPCACCHNGARLESFQGRQPPVQG